MARQLRASWRSKASSPSRTQWRYQVFLASSSTLSSRTRYLSTRRLFSGWISQAIDCASARTLARPSASAGSSGRLGMGFVEVLDDGHRLRQALASSISSIGTSPSADMRGVAGQLVVAPGQVHRHVVVGQALERQRDAHAKGGGGAEVVVELHGRRINRKCRPKTGQNGPILAHAAPRIDPHKNNSVYPDMATAGPLEFVRRASGWLRWPRRSALWQLLLLGALLLALIWATVLWQTRRDVQARQAEFRQNLMHLGEILDVTLVRQLDGIDNALLILRKDYLESKANLAHTVGLLRHGPLKGLDVHVTVVGRNGYSEFSDIPGYQAPVYLGDRPHFRHFADGGTDQLFISEPVMGRITKRWGIQLARPVLDSAGRFLGIIVIFLPPEELTRFMQPLAVGADTIMSVFSRDGALLSRSKELGQHLGTRLPSKVLADYQRQRSGFTIRRSVLDQVERGIAHRWIGEYPLLLVAARDPDAMLTELREAQHLLLWLGTATSLLVLLSLSSVARAMHLRQRAERRLTREHSHLAEAQRIAHLGSWEYDPAQDRWSWSEEVFRMLEIERQPADLPARVLFGRVHPEDRLAVRDTYERALKNRTAFDLSYRVYLPDGRTKWLHARGNRSLNQAGRPVMAGTVQDITERKYDEAAREALSRERLLLLESTGEGIYGIDRQGRCTFINQAASRMLGYEASEIIGKNIHEVTHHTKADGSPYPLHECPVYLISHSGEAVQAVREMFWRKDGTPVHVEYSAHPIRDTDVVTGTVVIFSDIGERRRTEDEMRIAATAFETQEGIFVTDAQGLILRVNSAFSEITGYSADEAVGKNPRFRSSGYQDAAFYSAMWARLRSSGAWKGEIWNRRKNGEIYPESVTITAVCGDDGNVSHYVATLHDITARKAGRGGDPPSGLLRSPDLATQSPPAAGPAATGAGRQQPQQAPWRADVHRPGQVQAAQRYARARHRRSAAATGRPAPAALRAPGRHGRAPGRRRIRGPAAGAQPQRSPGSRARRAGRREDSPCPEPALPARRSPPPQHAQHRRHPVPGPGAQRR